MSITLPPLPELAVIDRHIPTNIVIRGYTADQLRARDIEVAKCVLEAAAKYVEELPCACCWPEGSDSVAEEFSAGIRALEVSHE